MKVEIKDKFKITGRGIVLTGDVTEAGTLKAYDRVFIQQGDYTYLGTVLGIEQFGGGHDYDVGFSMGLILRPPPDKIEAGAILHKGAPIMTNHL